MEKKIKKINAIYQIIVAERMIIVKKVSIIVPCYNSETYLERCMNSLLNQTLKDIEIILIDDGSTDGTLNLLKKYEKEYPNIVSVVALAKNKGLGNARNVGISKASGEYIGFVDSDDYVDCDMFETLYQKAIADKSQLIECDFVWEYPNKNIIDTGRGYNVGKDMLINVRVMACNKIYQSTWLKKYNPQFAVGLKYEDVLFTYQYTPYVAKVSFVRRPFYHYVQRCNSLANHQTIRVREIYDVLQQVVLYYKNKKIYSKYKEELEYLFVRYLLGSSYKRACKIKDKKVRSEVLKEGWNVLNEQFPDWKKNRYLKRGGLKNKYFRLMNSMFYRINTIFFRIGR